MCQVQPCWMVPLSGYRMRRVQTGPVEVAPELTEERQSVGRVGRCPPPRASWPVLCSTLYPVLCPLTDPKLRLMHLIWFVWRRWPATAATGGYLGPTGMPYTGGYLGPTGAPQWAILGHTGPHRATSGHSGSACSIGVTMPHVRCQTLHTCGICGNTFQTWANRGVQG